MEMLLRSIILFYFSIWNKSGSIVLLIDDDLRSTKKHEAKNKTIQSFLIKLKIKAIKQTASYFFFGFVEVCPKMWKEFKNYKSQRKLTFCQSSSFLSTTVIDIS